MVCSGAPVGVSAGGVSDTVSVSLSSIPIGGNLILCMACAAHDRRDESLVGRPLGRGQCAHCLMKDNAAAQARTVLIESLARAGVAPRGSPTKLRVVLA